MNIYSKLHVTTHDEYSLANWFHIVVTTIGHYIL